MPPDLSASSLLQVWELGRSRHPIDRGLLLHAWAEPESDAEALADQPLGQRNRALLAARVSCFGRRLAAFVDCPRCAERLELTLDLTDFMPQEPVGHGAPLDIGGLVFRLPSSRDLARVEHAVSAGEDATPALLRACLVNEPADVDDQHLRALLPRVEEAFDRADPLADLVLDVRCDACGNAWEAPLDMAGIVWDEIDAWARGLLDEVHLLARAYGWREDEILGLTPARRAAYLERIVG